MDFEELCTLQMAVTAEWHEPEPPVTRPLSPFQALVVAQHRANFDLWHQEDAARDPVANDATIAAVKRRIDQLNQQRNNLAEQIDEALLQLASAQNPDAPLHSETPGLMVDRLSILALKAYHTEEESRRTDASPGHHARAAERLATLLAQREDLCQCLVALWADVLEGRRRFKLYRQFKMYNDPTMNPVLYRRQSTTGTVEPRSAVRVIDQLPRNAL